MNGIELQDREFFAAIRERREPNASVAQVLPAMQTLGQARRSASDGRSRALRVTVERAPSGALCLPDGLQT